MKRFEAESGELITASGIYRMGEMPHREITLVNGDTVPTFQRKKVKWRLVRAAKHPRKG